MLSKWGLPLEPHFPPPACPSPLKLIFYVPEHKDTRTLRIINPPWSMTLNLPCFICGVEPRAMAWGKLKESYQAEFHEHCSASLSVQYVGELDEYRTTASCWQVFPKDMVSIQRHVQNLFSSIWQLGKWLRGTRIQFIRDNYKIQCLETLRKTKIE